MRVLPSGRPKRLVGLVATGALLLGALVAQSSNAFAAAPAPAAAQPAAAQPAAGPQAAPKADPAAEHAAAVKQLQLSDPAGACPAALDPQTVVTCTVPAYGSAQLTLTLPQQNDLVILQVVSTQSSVYPTLTAPDGSAVSCENALGGGFGYGTVRCATGQAGTYTLKVSSNYYTDNPVALSYLPLLSATGCKTVAPADRKLGAPTAFHGSLAAGSAGDCYTTDLATGDVLRTSGPDYRLTWFVYDGAGKQICNSYAVSDSYTGLNCGLTGPAPYRVTVQQNSGSAQEYDLRIARLSKPEGCAVVDPQAYGAAPDLTSTALCRTLRVAAAGRHTYASLSTGQSVNGRLFEADGSLASCQSGDCDLALGDHTWVPDANNQNLGAYGMAFHSGKETRGCTAGADDGLVSGPVTGTYGALGQQRCLTLPTASGNGLYLLNRPPADGGPVAVEVDDAKGVKQCDNGGSGYGSCKLTGTAPFRAVLTGTPAQPYQLVIHRTGNANGCAAWPQSGYNGSWGAEVALTASVQNACLSVPAGQHSPAEMLDYANNLNRVNAAVYVVDAAGNTACSTLGSSTTTCQLTAGTAYTAMLVGVGQADTYHLVRRDISPSAPCTPVSSTQVGGPSTAFDFTSALDARCVRVSGAATDKFWLSGRTLGSRYDPSTLLMAVDADGKIQCRQWGISCKVTGSTSYVAVVVASGYQDKPIHADVDAWKVGGAGGWAPECAANKLSVNGFPQRSGVLTESATAFCGVVDMKPNDGFTIGGSSSSTTVENPFLSVVGSADWVDPNLTYQCMQSYGKFGGSCSALWNAVGGQAVLILSANKAATPVEYTLQGVPGVGAVNSGTPDSISPSTGQADTLVPAVIHGAGLSMAGKLQIVPNSYTGLQQIKPVSLSDDGTTLNVLVDTTGLAPGSYGLSNGGGYTSGVPSPGYVPNAFTVTAPAAPAKARFVPVTPARFLDTRDGTGAPKARVGGGGVVKLQVTGVKGVPATGVTAVVMNVTAVDPSEDGHVTVYPDGRPLPNVSNLNFAAHRTVPNLVTVPVVNGKVDLRNNSGAVDLIADVTGYYTDAAGQGSALTPITPARFLDTRDGTGAPKARVGGGGVVQLQVAGVKGVPASGVTAVVMNVTAVDPSEEGHVTVYPDGQSLPNVSNLNFTPHQIVPNLVTVPVVNGKVDLRNNSGSVDLIADVTGYYAATGSTFSAVDPLRLLDTRYGTGARAGKIGPDGIVSFQVGGVDGVPAGATAVVLNVTVTDPTVDSHLIVYPHGTDRPGVSNLNFTPGATVANLVVVPVVDGRVTLYLHAGETHAIADLSGYFAA
ncbi:hypothetical protein AB0K51_06965 [Kitasatospora sp. NPDC049285]|uniref:hypothetical protein n=1 Tax=Kitasatospora sp. NPDC049285 TaxID=3157096 RepID=UPI0034210CCD